MPVPSSMLLDYQEQNFLKSRDKKLLFAKCLATLGSIMGQTHSPDICHFSIELHFLGLP